MASMRTAQSRYRPSPHKAPSTHPSSRAQKPSAHPNILISAKDLSALERKLNERPRSSAYASRRPMEGQKAYLSRALNRGMTPGGTFSLQRYLDQIPARLEDGRSVAHTLISHEKLALWSAAGHTPSLEAEKAFQNIANAIGAKVDKLIAEKPYLNRTPSRELNPDWWKKWGSMRYAFEEDRVELKAPPKK